MIPKVESLEVVQGIIADAIEFLWITKEVDEQQSELLEAECKVCFGVTDAVFVEVRFLLRKAEYEEEMGNQEVDRSDIDAKTDVGEHLLSLVSLSGHGVQALEAEEVAAAPGPGEEQSESFPRSEHELAMSRVYRHPNELRADCSYQLLINRACEGLQIVDSAWRQVDDKDSGLDFQLKSLVERAHYKDRDDEVKVSWRRQIREMAESRVQLLQTGHLHALKRMQHESSHQTGMGGGRGVSFKVKYAQYPPVLPP